MPRRRLLWGLAGATAGLFAIASMRSPDGGREPQAASRDVVRAQGRIAFVRRVELRARGAAHVAAMFNKAGDRVRAGETLALLQSPAHRDAEIAAETALDAARAELMIARAAPGSVLSLADAERALARAQAMAAQARGRWAHEAVRSPVDGVIRVRGAAPGDALEPLRLIFAIDGDIGPHAEALLDATIAARVPIGARAHVRVGGASLDGRVLSVAERAGDARRRVMRVALPPDVRAAAGAPAEIDIAAAPEAPRVFPDFNAQAAVRVVDSAAAERRVAEL